MTAEDPLAAIQIVPLNKNINRKRFDCGVEPLNIYFQRHARQNETNFIGRHFVAINPDVDATIPLGFYTLSAGQVAFENLAEALRKGLPKYPVPVARIGRLAVANVMKGRGLGAYLLMNALEHTKNISLEIGIYGIVVDAKDEQASKFYQHFGFIPYADGHSLALPIQTVLQLFDA